MAIMASFYPRCEREYEPIHVFSRPNIIGVNVLFDGNPSRGGKRMSEWLYAMANSGRVNERLYANSRLWSGRGRKIAGAGMGNKLGGSCYRWRGLGRVYEHALGREGKKRSD